MHVSTQHAMPKIGKYTPSTFFYEFACESSIIYYFIRILARFRKKKEKKNPQTVLLVGGNLYPFRPFNLIRYHPKFWHSKTIKLPFCPLVCWIYKKNTMPSLVIWLLLDNIRISWSKAELCLPGTPLGKKSIIIFKKHQQLKIMQHNLQTIYIWVVEPDFSFDLIAAIQTKLIYLTFTLFASINSFGRSFAF